MAITYAEQYRRPARKGVDITVRFTDDSTGEVRSGTFYFNTPAPDKTTLTARMNKAISNIEFRGNALNSLDIEGVEVRPLLKDIVQYVRGNPAATAADLVSLINTKYPDLNWKPVKLLARIRERLGKAFTFTQFKDFCINKKFSGVDG